MKIMSKIKENNKQNFELISKLSDLMEQKNITSLEYEITEIKLKIEKKFYTQFNNTAATLRR